VQLYDKGHNSESHIFGVLPLFKLEFFNRQGLILLVVLLFSLEIKRIVEESLVPFITLALIFTKLLPFVKKIKSCIELIALSSTGDYQSLFHLKLLLKM
jgi:hypothetical protein